MTFLYELRSEHWIDIEGNPLKYVPTTTTSNDDWMTLASRFVADGYEGAILRKMDSPWEAKRTVSMLKFKPTEEDTYEILSVNEAIDKHGSPKDMVGSFTVRSGSDTEPFKVGAGKMPHSRRVELWRLRATLPGKTLRVKHEPTLTSGGVPLCAVAIDIL